MSAAVSCFESADLQMRTALVCVFNHAFNHLRPIKCNTEIQKQIEERGGSRTSLGGGAPLRNGVTNTNKPHIFFLQKASCVRKPQVISGVGGGGGCTPIDPSLEDASNVEHL